MMYLLNWFTKIFYPIIYVTRTMKNNQPELRNIQKNVLDGELICKFNQLSLTEKSEIAKRIGTSSDQVSIYSV